MFDDLEGWTANERGGKFEKKGNTREQERIKGRNTRNEKEFVQKKDEEGRGST